MSLLTDVSLAYVDLREVCIRNMHIMAIFMHELDTLPNSDIDHLSRLRVYKWMALGV